MPVKSSLATATAFSIFSSASRRLSSITSAPVPWSAAQSGASVASPNDLHGAPGRHPAAAKAASALRPADKGTDPLAPDRPHDVALPHQVEHDDRQVVVHAQADRRSVHDAQFATEHLGVVQVVEQYSAGVLARIGV